MEEQKITAPEQLKPYLFKQGESGNPNGRPKESEETKLLRKSRKQIIEEYKDALADALPLINPVLVAKAIEGDIQAIKEVHDRTMDKASQPTDITSKGERIMILPAELINKNDTTQNPEGCSTGQTQI